MHLYISSSNSRNTKFIAEDNTLWYTVETPWKFGSRTTTITRHQPKSEVIGQILWKTISQSLVRLGSVQLERKSFLRSKGTFSSHKYMTGSDGLEYEWKNTTSNPELWSLTSGRRVAYYISKNIFKKRKRHLVIEPEAETITDVIIVAYTIIDKRKKDLEIAIAITIAANAN